MQPLTQSEKNYLDDVLCAGDAGGRRKGVKP